MPSWKTLRKVQGPFPGWNSLQSTLFAISLPRSFKIISLRSRTGHKAQQLLTSLMGSLKLPKHADRGRNAEANPCSPLTCPLVRFRIPQTIGPIIIPCLFLKENHILLLICALLARATVSYFFPSLHYAIQSGVGCFHYHKPLRW